MINRTTKDLGTRITAMSVSRNRHAIYLSTFRDSLGVSGFGQSARFRDSYSRRSHARYSSKEDAFNNSDNN